MALESANWITELVASNPVGATDDISVGDNHIRMIKQVLQNVFPNASKANYLPVTYNKNANFTITAGQQNATFMVTTGAGTITASLPVLTANDAGWECSILKTSGDTNPIFIQPTSGSILSGSVIVSKARRCIPGARNRVLWSGTGWFVDRAVNAPLGSVLDFVGSSLLPGYEWPDGSALSSSANYPEYFALFGSLAKPDTRGTVTAGRPNGSVNGRIPDPGLFGITGSSTHLMAVAEMPLHNHGAGTLAVGTGINLSNNTGIMKDGTIGFDNTIQGGGGRSVINAVNWTPVTIGASLASGAVSGGTNLAGGNSSFNIVQPTLLLSKLLVVE